MKSQTVNRTMFNHGWKLSVMAATALIFAAGLNTVSAGKNPNPGIAPPNSTPYGKSYAEWQAAWYKWAFESPADQNPVIDATGEFCHIGQSGPVWFLAGSFGTTVTRSCTVPAGKALLFPLINSAWVQFPSDPPIPDECAANNYDCLREVIAPDPATEVSCEIDGVPLQGLDAYQGESVVFEMNSTEGSLVASFSGELGVHAPCVAYGWYVMVTPLPKGQHTIRLTGRVPDVFLTDVTYHLTVK